MTKRKIAQDNPLALAGAALLGGAVEVATSVAEAATGRGSPMGVDDEDGDPVAEFVKQAAEHMPAWELRRLGEALIAAADKGDAGQQAQDSAWGRSKPDAFERRFPGTRRIRQQW